MTDRPPLADLDAIRRRVSLVALVGKRVKLRKVGPGYSGLCPFHSEKTASFTVSDVKGFYHCFGCQAHGGIFDWVMETEGVPFLEAVRILGEDRETASVAAIAQREGPERADSGIVDSAIVGEWLWRTSEPARGSIVADYLRSRGLDPEGIPGGVDKLRFHPRAAVTPWRVGAVEGDARIRAPAMIAAMWDAGGVMRGVHATYLRRDGAGKAALPRRADGSERPTRKMWGSVTGNAVWLGGWPDSPRDRPLVVGEGIETVWAFVQELGKPCRAAAALSLDNLEGYPLLTPHGALPLWNVRADVSRACFVIEDPGAVLVLVDADMKPQERKVQRRRGERWVQAALTGAERAQLCAVLATQQWRRAGAARVDAVRPPLGMDFNDAIRGAGR